MKIIRETIRLVKSIVDSALADVHTHMPAQVVSYNETNNTVSVQPCINRIRTDDPSNLKTIQLPIISDVPVAFFGDSTFVITMPLTEGSYGILHFSERAIDKWLASAGIVDPASSRRFDLSDAMFSPGLTHFDATVPYAGNEFFLGSRDENTKIIISPNESGDPANIFITAGDTDVSIQENGLFRAENSNGYVSLSSGGTISINGTSDYAVAYNDLKTAFDSLKTTVNTHIHSGVVTGPGNTGALVTPATADISGAKVSTVQLP